jgi:hypothetical protein
MISKAVALGGDAAGMRRREVRRRGDHRQFIIEGIAVVH